jgi:hypothetical protein
MDGNAWVTSRVAETGVVARTAATAPALALPRSAPRAVESPRFSLYTSLAARCSSVPSLGAAG